MEKQITTLHDLFQEFNEEGTWTSVTGEHLKSMIREVLDKPVKEEVEELTLDDFSEVRERELAQSLWDTYYNPEKSYTEPLAKVYYYLTESSDGHNFALCRDEFLSPRGNDFFRITMTESLEHEIGCEYDPLMSLRDMLRWRCTIDGEDLYNLCNAVVTTPENKVTGGYARYQQQIAQAILDTFYADKTKCPKKGIYYKVTLNSYAEPKVYRDLERSPRRQNKVKSPKAK